MLILSNYSFVIVIITISTTARFLFSIAILQIWTIKQLTEFLPRIPQRWECWSIIRTLWLEKNQLTKIPDEISLLSQLQEIWLSGNNIEIVISGSLLSFTATREDYVQIENRKMKWDEKKASLILIQNIYSRSPIHCEQVEKLCHLKWTGWKRIRQLCKRLSNFVSTENINDSFLLLFIDWLSLSSTGLTTMTSGTGNQRIWFDIW